MHKIHILILILITISNANLIFTATKRSPKPKGPIRCYCFDHFILFSVPDIDFQVGFDTTPDTAKSLAKRRQPYTVAYNGENITRHQKTIFNYLDNLYERQEMGLSTEICHAKIESFFSLIGVNYKKIIPPDITRC